MSETSHDADDGKERTLVGISFSDTFRAQEFLTAATRLAANGKLRLLDAVFVGKDTSGKTVVRETVDPGPARSALSGALWAGLFGLILGGPVGWIVGAGVGAGTGVVAARMIDHGVSDEWVEWFRQAVDAGTTTLVLLAEDLDRSALVDELGRFAGAKLVYANLDPQWVDRMHTALGEPGATTTPSTPTAPPGPTTPTPSPGTPGPAEPPEPPKPDQP
jgi:uncharacterized membrane protein